MIAWGVSVGVGDRASHAWEASASAAAPAAAAASTVPASSSASSASSAASAIIGPLLLVGHGRGLLLVHKVQLLDHLRHLVELLLDGRDCVLELRVLRGKLRDCVLRGGVRRTEIVDARLERRIVLTLCGVHAVPELAGCDCCRLFQTILGTPKILKCGHVF